MAAAKKKIVDKKAQRAENRAKASAQRDAMASLPKSQRIELLLSQHPQHVQRASEANTSYLLRRPTGILGLDLDLGGGWPAAATSVIWGKDGVGKDYLLWRSMAESQQLYKDDFAAVVYLTEFLTDKRYIRDRCGLKIGMSDEEIDELNALLTARGRPKLTDEQAWYYQETQGQVITITGATAEVGFDRIIDFVSSNTVQIAAVNSIGFLHTEMKDATASIADNPQQRNEAVALTKFMTKLSTILNRGGPGGERIETAVLLLNQARTKDAPSMPGRPATEKDKMKSAADVWAVKHGKAIDLFLHNGEKIYDGGKDANGKPSGKQVGRRKSYELIKGKLGTHEGKKGEFDYYFRTGADVIKDLVDTGVTVGAVARSGAYYTIDDVTVQGYDKFVSHVRELEELQHMIRSSVMKKSSILFRYV
jgi:hypothetical protein